MADAEWRQGVVKIRLPMAKGAQPTYSGNPTPNTPSKESFRIRKARKPRIFKGRRQF